MLGMAIIRGEVDYAEGAETVPIRRKRKQGRPSRVARPLVRDDGR